MVLKKVVKIPSEDNNNKHFYYAIKIVCYDPKDHAHHKAIGPINRAKSLHSDPFFRLELPSPGPLLSSFLFLMSWGSPSKTTPPAVESSPQPLRIWVGQEDQANSIDRGRISPTEVKAAVDELLIDLARHTLIPDNYEGRMRLDLWINRIHGPLWYRSPDVRRAVDHRLRMATQRGALLITKHLSSNKLVDFDGFSSRGPGSTEFMVGRTVLQYFIQRGIHHLDPNLPCLQVLGGYSQRLNTIHLDYFPLEVIDFRFQLGTEMDLVDPVGTLIQPLGQLTMNSSSNKKDTIQSIPENKDQECQVVEISPPSPRVKEKFPSPPPGPSKSPLGTNQNVDQWENDSFYKPFGVLTPPFDKGQQAFKIKKKEKFPRPSHHLSYAIRRVQEKNSAKPTKVRSPTPFPKGRILGEELKLKEHWCS